MKTDWANDDDECGAPVMGHTHRPEDKHVDGHVDQVDELDPGEPAAGGTRFAELHPGKVPPQVATGNPELVLGGTFGVYAAPDGGFVLVTETGRGVERRHIPGKLVRLFTRGPMAKTLGGIFGGA